MKVTKAKDSFSKPTKAGLGGLTLAAATLEQTASDKFVSLKELIDFLRTAQSNYPKGVASEILVRALYRRTGRERNHHGKPYLDFDWDPDSWVEYIAQRSSSQSSEEHEGH